MRSAPKCLAKNSSLPRPFCKVRTLVFSCSNGGTRSTRSELEVPRDQSRAFIKTEIGPGPLEQNGETIAEPDQKDNVDEQPREPRRNSTQVHELQVRDCFVPADRRHAAFIEIPKALGFQAV